jgi:hypothetical protein
MRWVGFDLVGVKAPIHFDHTDVSEGLAALFGEVGASGPSFKDGEEGAADSTREFSLVFASVTKVRVGAAHPAWIAHSIPQTMPCRMTGVLNVRRSRSGTRSSRLEKSQGAGKGMRVSRHPHQVAD